MTSDASVTNPYHELGVPPDASLDDINKAFRRISAKCHPDKSNDRADHERFMRAKAAVDILRDEELRAAFDRDGVSGLWLRGADIEGHARRAVTEILTETLASAVAHEAKRPAFGSTESMVTAMHRAASATPLSTAVYQLQQKLEAAGDAIEETRRQLDSLRGFRDRLSGDDEVLASTFAAVEARCNANLRQATIAQATLRRSVEIIEVFRDTGEMPPVVKPWPGIKIRTNPYIPGTTF